MSAQNITSSRPLQVKAIALKLLQLSVEATGDPKISNGISSTVELMAEHHRECENAAYRACVGDGDGALPHTWAGPEIGEKALGLIELMPLRWRGADGVLDLFVAMVEALRARALPALSPEEHDIAMRLLSLAIKRTGEGRARSGDRRRVDTLLGRYADAVNFVHYNGVADSEAVVLALGLMPAVKGYSAAGVIITARELIAEMRRQREYN